MSRYGWNSDYSQGERDYERRERPDYERDRYASWGSPDHDYMDGFRHAEREAEDKREQEAMERRAEERREEERAEWLRQERWNQERAWEEQQESERYAEQMEEQAAEAQQIAEQ